MMLNTFFLIFLRDLRKLTENMWIKMVDSLIWVFVLVLVSGYILPLMGITPAFGALVLVSQIFCNSMIGGWSHAFTILNDIKGSRRVQYDLTLPLPSWLIFLNSALVYAVYGGIKNLPVIPVGKLLLGSLFSLELVSWPLLILLYIIVHVVSGCFGVWLASIAGDIHKIEPLWLRIVSPLWFFGCFQFPWKVLAEHYPKLAVLNLLNPFTYGFEGLRAATLGQAGYLNPWLCAGALCIISCLFMLHSLKRFKKMLDFV